MEHRDAVRADRVGLDGSYIGAEENRNNEFGLKGGGGEVEFLWHSSLWSHTQISLAYSNIQ